MTSPSLKGKELGGWKIVDAIGHGGQGAMYLVTKPGIDGSLIRGAMKTLTIHKNVDQTQMRLIVHELEMLKSANCAYLPNVIDSGSGSVKIRETSLLVQYIVMEFVNGDNLEQEIRDSGVLSTLDWWNLAHDLLMALAVMHEKGIVHADVKPGNVMRGARKTMLVDLGGASLVGLADPGDAGLMTPGWAAPEQYRPDKINAEDWGYEVDIFCAGQLLAFAATGQAPWGVIKMPRIPNNTPSEKVRLLRYEAQIKHAEKIRTEPPNLSGLTEEQLQFVDLMLAYVPEERLTASELLEKVREKLPEQSERKTGTTPQKMRWTPQSTDSGRTRPSAGSLLGFNDPNRVGNWKVSLGLLLFPYGIIFRYFFLDNREAWRNPNDRAEFRFVVALACLFSGGIALPIVLYRWWQKGAEDVYRWLALAGLVSPLAFFYSIANTSEDGAGDPAGIFIWFTTMFVGAGFAMLIPASALEPSAKRRKPSRETKRRFI
jgi:serine/threonine protein kinase